MSREDLADRVLAWLLERGEAGWIEAGGPSRLELCEQWRDVSTTYGAESPPAIGCLLALVTEAWSPTCEAGGGVVIVESDGPRGGFFVVTEHLAPTQRFKAVGGERAERLAAALEAAPK